MDIVASVRTSLLKSKKANIEFRILSAHALSCMYVIGKHGERKTQQFFCVIWECMSSVLWVSNVHNTKPLIDLNWPTSMSPRFFGHLLWPTYFIIYPYLHLKGLLDFSRVCLFLHGKQKMRGIYARELRCKDKGFNSTYKHCSFSYHERNSKVQVSYNIFKVSIERYPLPVTSPKI